MCGLLDHHARVRTRVLNNKVFVSIWLTIHVRKPRCDPCFKSICDIFNRWDLHRSADGELHSADLYYLFYVIHFVCIRTLRTNHLSSSTNSNLRTWWRYSSKLRPQGFTRINFSTQNIPHILKKDDLSRDLYFLQKNL